MSAAFDSIYPDFLKTGLGRLEVLGSHRDLQALFTALENFRHDLQTQETVPGILHVTQRYVAGLQLFHLSGIYLVNPEDFGFELALCAPAGARETLTQVVTREIQAGRFAWALRQATPVVFLAGETDGADRAVFHTLAQAKQVVGMFCGLLHHPPVAVQEIAFSLLSLVLGASADALSSLRKTDRLNQEVTTLSGLLPVCAWCKKVRDDRGYWEQIERYVETRSRASFSHGICPSCREKFFGAHERNR